MDKGSCYGFHAQQLVIGRLPQNEVRSIKGFYTSFLKNIEGKREDIERLVSNLAQTQRQDFRSKVKELDNCAKLYDEYERYFKPFEGETREFNQRVYYIRGIAAHYSNDPNIANKCLSKVIEYVSHEDGEDDVKFDHRRANAYYYLGIIKSGSLPQLS